MYTVMLMAALTAGPDSVACHNSCNSCCDPCGKGGFLGLGLFSKCKASKCRSSCAVWSPPSPCGCGSPGFAVEGAAPGMIAPPPPPGFGGYPGYPPPGYPAAGYPGAMPGYPGAMPGYPPAPPAYAGGYPGYPNAMPPAAPSYPHEMASNYGPPPSYGPPQGYHPAPAGHPYPTSPAPTIAVPQQPAIPAPPTTTPSIPHTQPSPTIPPATLAPTPTITPAVALATIPLDGIAAQAKLMFHVPEGTKLFVDGMEVPGSGPKRKFHTPKLPRGKTYFYEFRAEYEVNGEKRVEEKMVSVCAGDNLTESFEKLTLASAK